MGGDVIGAEAAKPALHLAGAPVAQVARRVAPQQVACSASTAGGYRMLDRAVEPAMLGIPLTRAQVQRANALRAGVAKFCQQRLAQQLVTAEPFVATVDRPERQIAACETL